jgi:hypothetical protein
MFINGEKFCVKEVIEVKNGHGSDRSDRSENVNWEIDGFVFRSLAHSAD